MKPQVAYQIAQGYSCTVDGFAVCLLVVEDLLSAIA